MVFGFDKGYYLLNNPDVAAAGIDAEMHYEQSGQREGRNPNAFFSESHYLFNNADVQSAVSAGAFLSGYAHFLNSGQHEGRAPYHGFDEASYLSANSDVASAVSQGILQSGWAHYVSSGWYEGRSGVQAPSQQPSDNPDSYAPFNEDAYLEKYSDVAAAVESGMFASGYDHWLRTGQREGRTDVLETDTGGFNSEWYYAAYSDVQAAGVNALYHYNNFGMSEGRLPFGSPSLAGNDTITTQAVVINGGAGNDILTGSGATARIFGETGNDTITSSAANTDMNGGSGNDVIYINASGQTALGGAGTDTIVVNPSAVVNGAAIYGNADSDRFEFHAGIRSDGTEVPAYQVTLKDMVDNIWAADLDVMAVESNLDTASARAATVVSQVGANTVFDLLGQGKWFVTLENFTYENSQLNFFAMVEY